MNLSVYRSFNGFGVSLKREYYSNLNQMLCIAHKLALTAGQVWTDSALFSDNQLTLKNVLDALPIPLHIPMS